MIEDYANKNKVSIPQGTIKTMKKFILLVCVIAFQFRKVQLRLSNAVRLDEKDSVSIPQGTIKTQLQKKQPVAFN